MGGGYFGGRLIPLLPPAPRRGQKRAQTGPGPRTGRRRERIMQTIQTDWGQ